MIPRYSRPEMVAVWSPETRFRIWFEIEAHATTALAELGVVPKEAAETIWTKGSAANFDVERIDEIERTTKHDLIAFLTHVAEIVGPDARFLHQGMTSSDVLDTCLAVQLSRASDLMLADIDRLLAVIKTRAKEHKYAITIGRSHGIHAEPTTFGIKLAEAYAEFARARDRLVRARAEIATCAISGAIGTFANIDPHVEAYVAEKLGLKPEPISTQVIPRDRHAMYFATLGVIASSIERVATEIRHLQRTEVLEAEEFFSPGQKGSSAMPHKRNPVLSENLTGLARLVRGMVTPALENVALWHERDISHSSVERMIGPDATITLDFALNRLTGLIEKLLVYPENMKRNLDLLGGLHNSQRVLLALTQAGLSREESYAAVQRNAMQVWQHRGDRAGLFAQLLKADPEVSGRLSAGDIDAMFDDFYHLKHVDALFERVFGPGSLMPIVYAREVALPVDDYIEVVGNSTLGPTRPLQDRDRVATMIGGAGLIVSARLDGRCIGLARCLTDFAWVAYLGDLAVHNDFQGRGIGQALLGACKDILGDGVAMALFSVPDAVGFYDRHGPALGLEPTGHAYFMRRTRGV